MTACLSDAVADAFNEARRELGDRANASTSQAEVDALEGREGRLRKAVRYLRRRGTAARAAAGDRYCRWLLTPGTGPVAA